MELRVQDTEFGINHELLPYLLDHFYLVDRGRIRIEGCVGLGLAIFSCITEPTAAL